MVKGRVIWKVSELVEIIKQRQMNEYDVNIAISGKRGDGKSTLANKILLKCRGFRQRKHQVYSREDVIKLLKTQKYSYCWNDEGISTAYKREFQNKEQQEFIKILTAYRDNFNVFITAIPFFYSLDKDLRDLIFMHIHIIERGLAIIMIQLTDSIHQTDTWDTNNNMKLENKWISKKEKNINYRIPYNKLSTFAGYLVFGDLSPKQKARYKLIKAEKRKDAFQTEAELEAKKDKNFNEQLFSMLINGELTRDGLMQICLANNKKMSSVSTALNTILKDNNYKMTLSKMLKPKTQDDMKREETSEQLKDLIPDVD